MEKDLLKPKLNMNIIVIGSGNLATHFARAFHQHGHNIQQVYSNTSANAQALADVVSAQAIDQVDEIDLDADLYLIAVTDKIILEVIHQIPQSIKGIIVHSSGATSINVLEKFEKSGVLYPPQSMNKNVDLDLSLIPFGVEGSDEGTTDILLNFIRQIAPKSFLCNSHQRLALHVSAVLVNNFPNALYQMAETILANENLSFDLLKPIVMETAQKVQNHPPKQVQTGPAVRNDLNTINSHLQFLSYSKELSQIYQHLTDFITKRQ